jgi:hypothetical protein
MYMKFNYMEVIMEKVRYGIIGVGTQGGYYLKDLFFSGKAETC